MIKLFDAYVINLDQDKDRLEHITTECTRACISFERFPALGLKNLPEHLKSKFFDAHGQKREPFKDGEIGCYASHLKVMEQVVERNRIALVMEDDIKLEAGFSDLKNLIEQTPEDWAFIRLSNPIKSSYHVHRRVNLAGQEHKIIEYLYIPNGTGSFLIHPRGAQKYLEYAKTPMRPIDEDLRRIWEHGCVTYGVSPPLCTPDIFDSSIDRMEAREVLPARKRFRKTKKLFLSPGLWCWMIKRLGFFPFLRMMANRYAQ